MHHVWAQVGLRRATTVCYCLLPCVAQVLAVRSFATEEEAVALANDTEYGLGNAVLTADAERCERVAQQLHAGVVWKNCSNAIPVEAPFGGFGQSGFGKEQGHTWCTPTPCTFH